MSVRPAAAVRADSCRAARTLVTAGRSFDVDVQDRDTGLVLEPVNCTETDAALELNASATLAIVPRCRNSAMLGHTDPTAALLAGVLASTTVFALCGRWPRTSRGQASAGWGSPKSAAASSPS